MEGLINYSDKTETQQSSIDSAPGRLTRRDLLKKIAGGMGILVLSGGFSSCLSRRQQTRVQQFWRQVDKIQIDNLVESVISAARAQIDYKVAFTASQRTDALLGADAGKEQRYKAEELFKKRALELRNAKEALARINNRVSKDDRERFDEYLNARGIAPLIADARRVAVRRLVAADIMPSEAKEALLTLDRNLGPLGKLRSFDELVQYLDRQLDVQIGKKLGNPGVLRGLCILLLVLSSMLIVLLVAAILVWVLVCILTLGFACEKVTVEEIFNDMIDDICGA